MSRQVLMSFLAGLAALFSIDCAVADPLQEVTTKIVSAMHEKMANSSSNVLVSETDFYDGDSHLSLPLAIPLKNALVQQLKQKGFTLIDPSSAVSTAWVVQCRWKLQGDDLTVAFIANPWKNWKRGTLITRAKVMSKATFNSALYQPDMDAYSRTLVHRLALNDNLSQPRSVYLRPLEINGSVAGKSAHSYFNQWLKNAVEKSNLLLPLDARQMLASIPTETFRTRGFRPVKKQVSDNQGTSLTNDLLASQSELKGNIDLQAQTVKVTVDLLDDKGKQLTSALVDVPLQSLPNLIAKDLREAGGMDVGAKVSVAGLQLDISTTRGEGEIVYRADEKIQFLLRLSQTAYLYLFDFDTKGNAVALYPNNASAIAVKPIEGGKIFVLPDDGLDYEIVVSEPFGKDIIWAVASEVPLAIPNELNGEWVSAKNLKEKVKAMGKATGKGYAEAQVMVVTSQ